MHQSMRRRQGTARKTSCQMVGASGTAGEFEEKSLESLLQERAYSEPDGVNHFVRTDDALSRTPNFGLRPDGYDLRQPHESKVSLAFN